MQDDNLQQDPWEQHAGWWQEGFTDGADAEYDQQIIPLATTLLAGYNRVLDVGAGEGQLSRAAAGGGSVRLACYWDGFYASGACRFGRAAPSHPKLCL